jgi:hypothetical protein
MEAHKLVFADANSSFEEGGFIIFGVPSSGKNLTTSKPIYLSMMSILKQYHFMIWAMLNAITYRI